MQFKQTVYATALAMHKVFYIYLRIISSNDTLEKYYYDVTLGTPPVALGLHILVGRKLRAFA